MGYKKYVTLLVVSVALCAVVVSSPIYAEDRFADESLRQAAIELSEFITISGPNPILKPDTRTTWDDENIEAGDAFEDLGTYYLYYHAIGSGGTKTYEYQIGVATATNPTGPFKKHGLDPILRVGPEGSWDDSAVACPMILKEGDEKYYMWYAGIGIDEGSEQEHKQESEQGFDVWCVGLATASNPLGPWKKYEGNPILKDFGYIGGVIKHDGKYRIYSVHPISAPGYQGDYGPLAVALADKPEGPYVKYAGNPIMAKGNPGDWDDGGPSEAEVLYHNGMFHLFYGGARIYGPRLESFGYAYSFDGFKWYKYGKNPVAAYQNSPMLYAFAEVHSIIELPYIYVYHTIKPEHYPGRQYPWDYGGEHLGMHVLVTKKPFSIDMPAFYMENIGAGSTTKLGDARPINLSNVSRLSLTVECKYSKNAKKPIRVHVRSSYDGVKYDTTDLYTLDSDLQPGRLTRKTFQLDCKMHFIMVIVENLDQSESVSEVQITATLGG